MSRSWFLLLLSVFLITEVRADNVMSVDDYVRKYPNDHAVILNYNQSVNVDFNEESGELEITKQIEQEILYLKETAKFFTSQSVNLSPYFEDLLALEVEVFPLEGKSFKLGPEDFETVDSPSASWVFKDDSKKVVYDLKELGKGYRVVMKEVRRVKHPEFFDLFYFVSGYPISRSTFHIDYPEGAEIAFFERNLENLNVVRQKEKLSSGKDRESWLVKDQETFREQKEIPDVRYYLPHLVVQIRSYKNGDSEKRYVGNLNELHDLFQSFLGMKEEETDLSDLHQFVNHITSECTSDHEKMDTIFGWVQSNIKYIAFEDGINGYVPRSCSSVMKNRYGDCKDMTSLLVEMLTHAGIENAYVAWVGTREIPYLMSEIPSPLACNHVICVVKKPEGGYYYLDATVSESGFNRPPQSVQEKDLLVHLGTDEYDLYRVPAPPADSNYIKTTITYNFTEEDSIFAEGLDVYGGYEREKISYAIDNLERDELQDYMKNITLGGHNNFTLKEYDILNLDNNHRDLEVKYDFSLYNPSLVNGDEIILNPSLFKPRVTKYAEEDFKYPRYKDHHRTIEYHYTVNIPEEYSLVHIPSDVHYNHEQFGFDGTFKTLENGNLEVKLIYSYDLLKIDTDLFEAWNEFSKAINRATIQNIILTKRSD